MNTTTHPTSYSHYERFKRLGYIFFGTQLIASTVFFMITFKLSWYLSFVIIMTGIFYTILAIPLTIVLAVIKKQFRVFLLPATFSLYLVTFEYYDSCLHRMCIKLSARDMLHGDITAQMAFYIHISYIFNITTSWYLTNEIYKHRKHSITVFSSLKQQNK